MEEDFEDCEECFEDEECSEHEKIESVDSESIQEQHFVDKFFKEVSKDKNVVVSPLSVEIVLAMAYQGASGETAEKLATVLEVENQNAAAFKYVRKIEALNDLKNVNLDIANKIFVMEGFRLKSTFKSVIEESFMSKIDPIDFSDNKEAADIINQCVRSKTKNEIENVISPDLLDESARLVLINALYFKSSWDKRFLEEDITIQPFYLSAVEAVDCEMMFIVDDFNYYSDHPKFDAKVLELPFKGKDVSMIIILPDEGDSIEEVEANLSKVDLSKLMENQNIRKVEVFLPKFKIEATTDVKSVLEKMELGAIGDPDAADFSEISENSKSLHVSQFIQKAIIEVDEKGAETTPGMENFEHEPKEFTVDRPFIFVLQANGENSNTVLFVGKVLNPLY